MNQAKLFGGNHQTVDALELEIKTTQEEFLESWKVSKDDAQRLAAYQKAWEAIFWILTTLGGEWQKVAASKDPADFPIITAIAKTARLAEILAGTLHLYSRRECGRLLGELVQMGITHKTAVAMMNMPKDQLDALFEERIAELKE